MSTLSAVWIGWYAAIVSMRVGKRRFTGVLPPDTAGQVPETAKGAVPAAADRLMKGEREVLGVVRTDLTMPDWFWIPSLAAARRRTAMPSGSSWPEQARLAKNSGTEVPAVPSTST